MRIKSICIIIFIGLFLLISVCSADETPGYKILIEGGESILIENEDGSMILTIQNVVPYGVIFDDPEYITLLETVLPDTNTTMNAGVVLSNPDIVKNAHVTRIFLEKGLPVSENFGDINRCMDDCERYHEKPTRFFCEMNCAK